MPKTKRNIQITIDIELIQWMEENNIKKSELLNKLLKEYVNKKTQGGA